MAQTAQIAQVEQMAQTAQTAKRYSADRILFNQNHESTLFNRNHEIIKYEYAKRGRRIIPSNSTHTTKGTHGTKDTKGTHNTNSTHNFVPFRWDIFCQHISTIFNRNWVSPRVEYLWKVIVLATSYKVTLTNVHHIHICIKHDKQHTLRSCCVGVGGQHQIHCFPLPSK